MSINGIQESRTYHLIHLPFLTFITLPNKDGTQRGSKESRKVDRAEFQDWCDESGIKLKKLRPSKGMVNTEKFSITVSGLTAMDFKLKWE